ncbi:GMC family oxidoreductase N-terminal domain-containing protein [Streptomyces sp. NBC_01763]|uniref:GMC family oxidoreductase N-terminal domain-containing protein n=1 Tax=Streptomyces sp. NBC_01763 TaxID=2975934 RepID=UPI002DD8C4CC|nr:GMC family oxidoreductase N-terminal domain-containing protein [Streptomyces sp. NBC_01763]
MALLEAGGPDRKATIHIPAAFSQLFKTELDWDYTTVPQTQLSRRPVYWPRGRMLGGSSSINAMMWV